MKNALDSPRLFIRLVKFNFHEIEATLVTAKQTLRSLTF